MQQTNIRQIATELVQLFGPTDWAIGGSFLLQSYGIEPQARDLDLVCTLERFEAFKTLLSQYAHAVPVSRHPIYRSKGFARFSKNGLVIELMAGIQVLKDDGLQGFEFFDYGKIGLPMLIVGTIFYATIGKRFLPATPSRTPDASYQGNDDYSHIPSWKKWIAGLVLVGTVAAMIFEKELGVKLYVSAWIGALILVATNVITETAAIKSIDMKTIMLFAGSLALGDAMVKTGTGSVIADTVVAMLGTSPEPLVLLVVIFILSVFMTNFMSNTATCALLVPIGLSLANQLGFDPKAVIAAIVVGSSLAYATPIGMPANTMVYNIAGYSFMDYVKAGIPLIVVSMIVSLILLPILFPFHP